MIGFLALLTQAATAPITVTLTKLPILATGMSGDGTLFFGSGPAPEDPNQLPPPVVWTKSGGSLPVPVPAGFTGAAVSSASADGTVLAGTAAHVSHMALGEPDQVDFKACCWHDGKCDIVMESTEGALVSADGRYVFCGRRTDQSQTMAFRWRRSDHHIDALLSPEGALRTSMVKACSSDGQSAFGIAGAQNPDREPGGSNELWRAGVWDAAGKPSFLGDPSWQDNMLTGCSGDGLTAVGSNIASGIWQRRGAKWILVKDEQTIPYGSPRLSADGRTLVVDHMREGDMSAEVRSNWLGRGDLNIQIRKCRGGDRANELFGLVAMSADAHQMLFMTKSEESVVVSFQENGRKG